MIISLTARVLDVCQLHVFRESDWARFEFVIGGVYTDGKLVDRSADFLDNLKGLDETTLAYQSSNWISGIMSGALYTFRALRLVRQRLVLTRLEGLLHSTGMHGLACATSIGVARLLGQEAPPLELNGWQIECKILSPVEDEIVPIAESSTKG